MNACHVVCLGIMVTSHVLAPHTTMTTALVAVRVLLRELCGCEQQGCEGHGQGKRARKIRFSASAVLIATECILEESNKPGGKPHNTR